MKLGKVWAVAWVKPEFQKESLHWGPTLQILTAIINQNNHCQVGSWESEQSAIVKPNWTNTEGFLGSSLRQINEFDDMDC